MCESGTELFAWFGCVVQAADVLVYRGTHVPVGVDQLQHLQVASQLVRTFHHRFGRTFPTPRPLLAGIFFYL